MGKWTRRAFLTAGVLAGGGLIVGIAIRPGNRTPELAKLMEKGDEVLVNAWVKLLPDNRVTVIVPHVEMGQGAHTALPMMLAEDMDVDWDTVSIEEAPAHEAYVTSDIARDFVLPGEVPGIIDDTIKGAFIKISQAMDLQITGGSYSVRGTGVRSMRVAGAAVRQLLIQAAAQEWGVPESEIRTEKSVLFHDASERSAQYVHFAKQVAEQKASNTPTLKPSSEFTIIGKREIQRFDIPAKVDGSAQFGMDVAMPNMKYATIKAPSVFGSTVNSVDGSAALQQNGVHKVVNLGDCVAVIADGYWQAKKAIALVKMELGETGFETLNTAGMLEKFRADLDLAVLNGDEKEDYAAGDARSALSDASSTIEAEYSVPYLAHATMEPMNCTALIDGDTIHVWTGTQNPLGTRNALAEEFDFDPHKVQVHNHYLGGGFGRRANPDYPIQAVKIAKQMPGTPVKLIWSREEDTRHDYYRQAMVSRFKGGLDADGNAVAWENQFHEKHEPVEASDIPYSIANKLIHYTDSPTHIPFGAWRSVDHSAHAFFTESFVDELAVAANKDSYEFRRRLLADQPRIKKVLETAATMAGWGSDLPTGWGRGIALHSSFGTIVAQVAVVDVSGGEVKVDKVYCAADPGYAVSPDGFTAQMESGIIFGLTAALYGDITIENGAVKQSNFHDYPMVRMKNAPEIEVSIINSGEKVGGGGEPGTPPIAPAVANAVYAATNKRIRRLPIQL